MRFGKSLVLASVVASFCAGAMAQQTKAPKVHVYVEKGIAGSDNGLSSTNEKDKAAIINAAAQVPLVEGCIRAASALNQLYTARSIPAFERALAEGNCKTALTSEDRTSLMLLVGQYGQSYDDSIQAYIGGDNPRCSVVTHTQYLDSSNSGVIKEMFRISAETVIWTGDMSKAPAAEASLKVINDAVLAAAAKTDESCKAIAAARQRQKDVEALGDVMGE